MAILDIYATRCRKVPDVFTYDGLPDPLRHQIADILSEIYYTTVDDDGQGDSYTNLRNAIVEEVIRGLRRELGRPRNWCQGERPFFDEIGEPNPAYRSPWQVLMEDLVLGEGTEVVLSVIELLIRKSAASAWARLTRDNLIEEIDHRFRQHGVGYRFVDGKIMRVDHEHLHAEAVLPALAVLADPAFAGANAEYRQAHEHYRKGEEPAAIIECGKAFESTLKIICRRKGWAYDKDRDTASKLVAIVIKNGLFPPFSEQMLNSLGGLLASAIPTPRNKGGVAHGRGPDDVVVPGWMAKHILHMTASTIVMLVDAEKALGKPSKGP